MNYNRNYSNRGYYQQNRNGYTSTSSAVKNKYPPTTSFRHSTGFKQGYSKAAQKEQQYDDDNDDDNLSNITNETPRISNRYSDGTQSQQKYNDDSHDDDLSHHTNETPKISNCSSMQKPITYLNHNDDDDDMTFPSTVMDDGDKDITINLMSRKDNSPTSSEDKFDQIYPHHSFNSSSTQSSWWNQQLLIHPLTILIWFTVSFILSLYSSLSCKFLTLHLDFIPTNISFKQKNIKMGPWSFYSLSDEHYGHRECLRYPIDFSKKYIHNDDLWKTSRAFGILSILVGWVGFGILTIILTKSFLSTLCSKYDAMHSAVMYLDRNWMRFICGVSFFLMLSESIKFTFSSINICSGEVWLRYDGEMIAAKGCSLSNGGNCGITSIIFYVIIMIVLGVHLIKNECGGKYSQKKRRMSLSEKIISSSMIDVDDDYNNNNNNNNNILEQVPIINNDGKLRRSSNDAVIHPPPPPSSHSNNYEEPTTNYNTINRQRTNNNTQTNSDRYQRDENHTNVKSKNNTSLHVQYQENYDIESWRTSANVARRFRIDSSSDEDSECGVLGSDNNQRMKSYWDDE